MKPETQLNRLEAWYEELVSGKHEQARGNYVFEYTDGVVKRCCLNVANIVRGNHSGREKAAAKWVGVPADFPFMDMNDRYRMDFYEIADVILHEGINPLRAALGMDPYWEGDKI